MRLRASARPANGLGPPAPAFPERAFGAAVRRAHLSFFSRACAVCAASLFALQRYKDAIAAFQALLDDHADNAHAPQAMLGLANCQVELRQLRAARLTLEHLIKRFPNSEAAQTAHARLKKLK